MPLLRSLLTSAMLFSASAAWAQAAPQSAPAATAPAATAATSAAPVFSDTQRQAIEAIVKDYLVKNPDVLQEAIAEGEKRAQETQKLAQAAALKESRDTLTNSPHGVVVGNPAGDITVVEFFDYNCGYCRKALGDIQALVKSDPKLRVVLRDFPVLGAESLEASKLALAAKQQLKADRMFEFHVKLLETKGRVTGERAIAVAKEMGLDTARLAKDAQGPEVKAALSENVSLGDKLGLSGTPAFIIGDEVIPGAVGVDPIRKVIADVRQCGHAGC
ncbi:disulfide bond formation protein DsbA [Methylobacterium sp. Leaf102]|uniref:DsbA family protein n=1 Tax=unclassified Methylobacterium TaxID=2615210 RepID=UPI0006FF52C6|nr:MULTISPECIES: DsbA family protein [unclassified Methylobacterium]KQP31392.1 disulfide bond formation protein DsbA [Methylobacterium sp. Leaf102]KQP67282.1 disulfide bond formation protein DsbA [Methylobacterium sp. Leaf112]